MASYIVNPSLSDAATFTASNAVGGNGVANAQDPRPNYYYQSTTTTPFWEVDFGVAVTLDVLIAGYINAQSGDTLRVRAATSQANLTAAPGFDPGVVNVWPTGSDLSAYRFIHRAYRFGSQTFRWWRVDWGFGGNTDGYVRVGRAFWGLAIQPGLPIGMPWSFEFTEPRVASVDIGGNTSLRKRGVIRSTQIQWPSLRRTEIHGVLQELVLTLGSSADFCVVVDDSVSDYPMGMIYIGSAGETQRSESLYADVYTLGLPVTELAPIEMR